MKKLTLSFAVAVSIAIFSAQSFAAPMPFSDGIDFDVLPTADPETPFSKTNAGNSDVTLSVNGSGDTIGTINTTSLTEVGYRRLNSADVQMENDSTVEVRLRITSAPADRMMYLDIFRGPGQTTAPHFAIALGHDDVEILNSGVPNVEFAIDNTQFRKFRFTVTGDGAASLLSVYVDDNPIAVATANSSSGDGNMGLRFFSYNEGGANDPRGIAEIDYISWTDGGAFAPIPEPAGLALLAGAGLLLGRRMRR